MSDIVEQGGGVNHWLWLGTLPLTALTWLSTAWVIPTRSAEPLGWLLGETVVAVVVNGLAWWWQYWRTQAIAPPAAQGWLLVLVTANGLVVAGCHVYRQKMTAPKSDSHVEPSRHKSGVRLVWRNVLQVAIVASMNWLWGGALGLYVP